MILRHAMHVHTEKKRERERAQTICRKKKGNDVLIHTQTVLQFKHVFSISTSFFVMLDFSDIKQMTRFCASAFFVLSYQCYPKACALHIVTSPRASNQTTCSERETENKSHRLMLTAWLKTTAATNRTASVPQSWPLRPLPRPRLLSFAVRSTIGKQG